jgi:hypothetical protein
MYEAWEKSGRRATSIHSSFTQIDEHGRRMDRIVESAAEIKVGELVEQAVNPLMYVQTLEPIVFGCAHAFSGRLFKDFGNLPDHIIHEDNILAFRTILAGKLIFINEPLVKYRVHGGNVFMRTRNRCADLRSLERQEERLRRDFRNRETMYDAFLLDLEKTELKDLISKKDAEKVREAVCLMRRRYSLMGEFLERGFVWKCRILARLRQEGLTERHFKLLLRRLLPRPLLVRLRLASSYAALAWKRSL